VRRCGSGEAVGLFYYASHAIQVKGEDYLIPVGADIRREHEVPDECLSVSSVLRAMENAGNQMNIIILDACRDTIFVTRALLQTGPNGQLSAPPEKQCLITIRDGSWKHLCARRVGPNKVQVYYHYWHKLSY